MHDLRETYRGVESPVLQYGDTTAFIDGRDRVKNIAAMNLALRVFALGLIILCGIIFRYAQNAVTVPIERMVSLNPVLHLHYIIIPSMLTTC